MTDSQFRFHDPHKLPRSELMPDVPETAREWRGRLAHHDPGCIVNAQDFTTLAGRAIANTISSDPRTAAILESLATAEQQIATLTRAPIGVRSETVRILAEYAFPGEDFHEQPSATVLPFASPDKSDSGNIISALPQFGA